MNSTNSLTPEQDNALRTLCRNYHTEYLPDNYTPAFDLPTGWVAGWAGPIYVGVDPEGHIHS
jgi:hypothetical protein